MRQILDTIVEYKKKEVAQKKKLISVAQMKKSHSFNRSCHSIVKILEDPSESGIIAEFKRKSPSKQNINLDADLMTVTSDYVDAGASALSILTDNYFFGGQDSFLSSVRKHLPQTPILRKEFIIDEFQIYESKSIGADLILLIAEVLTKEEILSFTRLALSLGMEVLLELHAESQVKKLNDDISIIGVNNRDLRDFSVDFERSMRLFDQLPSTQPKIAESGLKTPETLIGLYNHGFKGFLIGEQFMKQQDPGNTCRKFIMDYQRMKNNISV